jgi:hypothetical protein
VAVVGEEGRVLEHGVPLSESVLWKLQRQFYADSGADPWTEGFIPDWVTTTPSLAERFADLVTAYLRDWASEQGGLSGDAPVYVVEVGAGPGRFGFRLAARLSAVLAAREPDLPELVYVMTDISASRIGAWRRNRNLSSLVDAGLLDFAHFDACEPGPIHLLQRDTVIETPTENPLVVIANYVLDSLPADLLRIERGNALDAPITLTQAPGGQTPIELDGLAWAFDVPGAETRLDGPAEWTSIVSDYARALPNTCVLFPVAALRCVQHLELASGGRMLFLAADKGHCHLEELAGCDEPAIVRHGAAFSVMVNFDAIGRYATLREGEALLPSLPSSSLALAGFTFGAPATGHRSLRFVYGDAVRDGSVDDALTIRQAMREHLAGWPVDDLIAYVRDARWDDRCFLEAAPHLIAEAGYTSSTQRAAVRELIRRVDGRRLDLGPDGFDDAAGVLLHHLGFVREAIEHFERLVAADDRDSGATHNLAACHFELEQHDEARRLAERALELDPANEPARELMLRLRAGSRDRSEHRWSGPPASAVR